MSAPTYTPPLASPRHVVVTHRASAGLLEDVTRGAVYNIGATHRYMLWRLWRTGEQKVNCRMLNFLMLNPSTATERENDPTVERCERRARQGGYGGFIVTNLFALRSTDPAALKLSADPVGEHNDFYIVTAAKHAATVVCAWGNEGGLLDRADKVVKLLKEQGTALHALQLSQAGVPYHPLYLSYSLLPKPWTPGKRS
jgi:hypothetical protein